MKAFPTFLLIASLVLCVMFVSVLQPEHFFGTEYDVRVINGFKNNMSLPLVIWCSSADIDLGGRALQEGDDYGWRLKTSIWATSHYFCTMKWDQLTKKFVVFSGGRDKRRCGPLNKCSWLVREDGFYFSNDEVNWNKDFSWI